jgi:hypothetical protein
MKRAASDLEHYAIRSRPVARRSPAGHQAVLALGDEFPTPRGDPLSSPPRQSRPLDGAGRRERALAVVMRSWVRGRTRRYAYYHCPGSHVSTPKAKLEDAYLALLAEIASAPEFMRLFKAVVLDVYRSRQDEAKRIVADLDRRLAQIVKRKARLEEAYLYEGTLDRDAYVRHRDRLSEERALLLLGRHEAELDGLDVETLMNYAEYMALNPGRLWQEAGVEQKSRFQRFVFQLASLGTASDLEP